MASTENSVKKVVSKEGAKKAQTQKGKTPATASKKTSSTAAKRKSPASSSKKTVAPVNTKIDPAARKINELHALARDETISSVSRIVHSWSDVGEALLAEKKKTPHGQWIPWINKHLAFSPRQAQKYIKAFEERDNLLDAGSMNLDTALLTISPQEEIVEARLGSDSSDKEIEALKADLKKAKADLEKSEALVRDLENDDSASDFEKLYEDTLAELEDLKKQGSESADDVEEDITRLKKSRAQLKADISGMRNMAAMMSRARSFFAKEIALIPTLNLSRVTVKSVKKDVQSLLDTMRDWADAMEEKFDV